jgi:hypothetical protein
MVVIMLFPEEQWRGQMSYAMLDEKVRRAGTTICTMGGHKAPHSAHCPPDSVPSTTLAPTDNCAPRNVIQEIDYGSGLHTRRPTRT